MIKKTRQLFIRGLLALTPIVLTGYILYSIFIFMDNLLGPYVKSILGKSLPGVGLIAGIFLIFIMGFLISNVIGEKLYNFIEKMVKRIPLVTKVYFGIKQIIDAFSIQGKQVFSKVVLIEYPRKGTYVVGFLTGECKGEVQTKTAARLMNVFVPTTPNPTSGMLILVPENDITYLDMTVEEGLKLIVSAGVVVPEDKHGKVLG
jgi:uncharacterized membrane protein